MSKISKNEWSSNIVKHIKFEDFIMQDGKVKSELNNFLEIPNSLKSSYSKKKSLKNIGIYKNVLSDSEIEILEDLLKKYLH